MPKIDHKQTVGTYEFTVTPRSLFAPNGEVLPCSDKSKLIHALNKLATTEFTEAREQLEDPKVTDSDFDNFIRKTAVLDGMVLLQKLTKKSASVVSAKDLSVCFNDNLVNLTKDFDEITLVFDTYKAGSLKNRTRQKRPQGRDSVQYEVQDETTIKHIMMRRFLSHAQTETDLTEYLAQKTLYFNKDSSKLMIITSAAGHTRSNKDVSHFSHNNHEEADTLGVFATGHSSRNVEMTLFSPDTNVLVLLIANYDVLPKNTSISMASGTLHIKANMDSSGTSEGKSIACIARILWGRQHWSLCTDRQTDLVQAVPRC